MEVHILDAENTILNSFLYQIRDVNIQKEKAVFRNNMEKCGEILAYEISKELNLGTNIDLIPDLNDPKDLYGLIL